MKRYNYLVDKNVNGIEITYPKGFNPSKSKTIRQPEETARMKILWKNLRDRRDARAQNRFAMRQVAIVAALNLNSRLETARLFYTLAMCTPGAIADRGHPMGREWLKYNFRYRER